MGKDIKKEFKDLRMNLLDLTSRNPLLNFKQRSKSIEIVNSTPSNIYNFLILQHKKMYFLSNKKEPERQTKSKLSAITEPIKEAFEPITEQLTELNKSLQSDDSLKSDLTPSELQKRLFYINQLSKTMIQEKGYNVLYLATGFLEWSDRYKPADIKRAPLALIPVVLERKSVGKSFSIQWNGEDIKTNISLKAKLKEDGLILPDFKMKSSIDSIEYYFSDIKKSLSKGGNGVLSSWNISNDVALGFFSFTKFVMYMDLDPNLDLKNNELIESIFRPDPNKDIESFNSEDIDKKLSYKDLYNVLDADSSQIAVIEDVKAGRNLVVEGPPGTGKSQTIVNLIAELIGSGKSVLFVSEKMAALEVVKNRLESVGLGKFVLQLHSHRTSRRSLLKEIKRGLNRRDLDDDLDVEQTIRKLESLRSQLDEYVEVLHEKNYAIEMSPFELYGMKEIANDHFSKKGMIIPLVPFDSPENITKKDLDDMVIELENLAELHHTIGENNPWTTCSPNSLLPGDLREIQQLLIDSENYLNEFTMLGENLNKSFGIKFADNLEIFEEIKKALDIFNDKNVKLIDKTILSSFQWFNSGSYGLDLIKKLDEYQKTLFVMKKFYASIENEDIDLLINEFMDYNSKGVLKLFKKNKPIKKKILSFYKDKYKGSNDKNILEDLQDVNRFLRIKNGLHNLDDDGKKYFGDLWYLDVDISQLKSVATWVDGFNKFLKDGTYNKLTIEKLSDDLSINNHWELNEYLEIGEKFYNSLKKLKSKLNPNINLIFKNNFENVPLTLWKKQVNKWSSDLSRLHIWSQYLNTKNSCLETSSKMFVKVIEDKNLKKEDVKSLIYGNFADVLLQLIFSENQYLSSFIGELHENKIKDFKKLDLKIIELNRKRIYYKLNKEIPEIFGNTTHKESKILAGELTRKRGNIPLRTLLKKTGLIIKQIKPCFMMSPLSIAEFLDPSNSDLKFDVVVFDEASQVKPEDALGAFMRAKTAVVIGDTQQLPPTSFFDQMISSESDDEIATALDMESILHLCKLSFPVRMLKWHYRSRHETLINLSNKEFYNGELLVYPSATYNNPELGLKFKYNPDNPYQRGKSATNRGQAIEVVDEIFKHFKKYGTMKSLGVGTFSVSQMNAILEELEIRRKEHPELEHLFSEKKEDRFFVKNLETIQGDERDVMLISIGYGFDEFGKLSSNFGPLNQDGGERRLNVLITRAKEKCVVFSNFKAYDMHLGVNTPFGVEALRNFLEYAENASKGLIQHKENRKQETFVNSVYNFLKSEGFKVHKNVGDFFKIDLAILDDEDPGKYILGIECDGENYESSKVARDRDRLRDQVLNGLDWNLYHLWSTDWYRNRNFAQTKLINSIDKTKEEIKIKEEERIKEEELLKEKERLEQEKRLTEMNFEEEIMLEEERFEEDKTEEDKIEGEIDIVEEEAEIVEGTENIIEREETIVEEFKEKKEEFEDNRISIEKKEEEFEESKNENNNKRYDEENIGTKFKFKKSLKDFINPNKDNNSNKSSIDNYNKNNNKENNEYNHNYGDNEINSNENNKNKKNRRSYFSFLNNKTNDLNKDFDSINENDSKNDKNQLNEDNDYLEEIISSFDDNDNGTKDYSNIENSNIKSEDFIENNEFNRYNQNQDIYDNYSDDDEYYNLTDLSNPLSKNAVIENQKDNNPFKVLSGLRNEVNYIKKALKHIENKTPRERISLIDRTDDELEEDNTYINKKIDYKDSNLMNKNSTINDKCLDDSNDNTLIDDDFEINKNIGLNHDEYSDEFLEDIINKVNTPFNLENQMKHVDNTIIPKKLKDIKNSIEPYKKTKLNINKTLDEFYKTPDKEINHMINKIVLTEGPIHIKEVIGRIKEGLNLSRATSKFKNRVNEAIKNSENAGLIFVDDDFLFSTKEATTQVRKREKPNIDLISDVEIEENIRMILEKNNTLKNKDLIKQVSKNFGFKSATKKTSLKVAHVIDYLLAKQALLAEDDVLKWNN
ncbi:MAG: conserved hypothetical protein [Methanobrevibacter sp. CfCl-M3]